VIVAHAAATTALLSDGRLFLGLGTGEALNEHVLGDRWPPADVRLSMLDEAIGVIRLMWTGETIDHRGAFYQVENARLFDPPPEPPPIIVSGFGPKSVELAARIGDGYWGHSPHAETIEHYERSGGRGPRYAQLNLCWGENADIARKTVHEVWPNGGLTGQLLQDLPTWTHFEEAVAMVSEADATKSVPCGSEVEPLLDSVRRYVNAGYDHLYFHQIGPDQEGFFRFWSDELRPAIAEQIDTETPEPKVR
jgi:G6PDH family F420-dependent oxidoreductase